VSILPLLLFLCASLPLSFRAYYGDGVAERVVCVVAGGCNHMTCKCGFQFCWLCLAKYESSHFSSGACAGKQFT
jgi:hypothetical protein